MDLMVQNLILCNLFPTIVLIEANDLSDKISVFKTQRIIVKINMLKFSIQDLKYGILYKTFKPQATAVIK